MILPCKCSVLSVFDRLEIFLQVQFRVKQTVFINVLLVFDLLLVRKLRHILLMLVLQSRYLFLILFFCGCFFQHAALFDLLEILAVKVGVDIPLCVRDQLRDLSFIVRFNGLRFFQLAPGLCDSVLSFSGCKALILLRRVDHALKRDNLIRTIYSQTIDFCLNFTNIILDRPAEFKLLLRRKDLTVSISHILQSPSL